VNRAVQALDWAALSPVVAVAVTLLLILLVDAVGPAADRLRRVHDVVAGFGLLAAGGAVTWLAVNGGDRSTLCVGQVPDPAGVGSGLAPRLGSGLGGASCSYLSSSLTLTLQGLILATALVSLLLTLDGTGAADRAPHHLLLLTAVAGALALAGVRDLASFVVALEVASLPAIGLSALRRDARGAQAGVTLLLTAVASLGLLLLGTALLLLATGSLHLDRIAGTLSQSDLPASVRAVAVLGTLLAVSGVAFKLSAVPFHLWTPDTYAGAPMPIAAFLSVVSKAAGLTALVVLLLVGLPGLADSWALVVGVVAAVTVTVGNLVALRQTVAVRLLAWSTVAQAGWVLLPLAGARAATEEAVRSAAAASVGYLAAYAVASLGVRRGGGRVPASPGRGGAHPGGLPRVRTPPAGGRLRARLRPALPGRAAPRRGRAGRQGGRRPAPGGCRCLADRAGRRRQRGAGRGLLPALGPCWWSVQPKEPTLRCGGSARRNGWL
jgi:NADH-quinone oxidoreductase subunit N